MNKRHKLQSQTAGPVWGLVFGMFIPVVGIGLWCYAETAYSADRTDELAAVASVLIGVFPAVCAGREIHRKRNRSIRLPILRLIERAADSRSATLPDRKASERFFKCQAVTRSREGGR